MKCSIADMRNKEVINLQDGTRLGFVGDVEIDTENAKLTTIIIYGRSRLFGLLGRTDDIMMKPFWSTIPYTHLRREESRAYGASFLADNQWQKSIKYTCNFIFAML